METKKTAVVLATVATMAVAPGAAFAAGAQADGSTATNGAANDVALTQTVGVNWATPIVQEQTVEGTFSFSQATVTPIEKIRAVFQKAAAALCGADDELTVANAADWSITVGGDVQAGYSATLGELAQDDENTTIMGCACVSNAVHLAEPEHARQRLHAMPDRFQGDGGKVLPARRYLPVDPAVEVFDHILVIDPRPVAELPVGVEHLLPVIGRDRQIARFEVVAIRSHIRRNRTGRFSQSRTSIRQSFFPVFFNTSSACCVPAGNT